MVGALPQPRAQSPNSGPGRSHNRVTRPETVTSPSSHIHAIRKERTHIHGHQDHTFMAIKTTSSARESSGTKSTKKIRTAGRTNPRPRPPSVPPAANGPRRLPSRWRRSARSCRSPAPLSGGTADRGRMGSAGLNRQGGDIGDLHPPGAPGPMSRQITCAVYHRRYRALITAALSDHSEALSKGRCVNRIHRRARRCGRGRGRVRPPGRLPVAHRCPGEDRAGHWAPDRRPVHRQRCGGDHRRCAGRLGGHRVRHLSPCRAMRTRQRGVRGRGRGCAPGVVGARGGVRAVRPRRLQSAVRAA